jgi:uncharacterized membrane protein YwzB
MRSNPARVQGVSFFDQFFKKEEKNGDRNVLILTKKWLGYILGDFFANLLWSAGVNSLCNFIIKSNVCQEIMPQFNNDLPKIIGLQCKLSCIMNRYIYSYIHTILVIF